MAPRPPGHLFHKTGCLCRACSGKTQALPERAGGAPSEAEEQVKVNASDYSPERDGPLLVGATRTKKGRVRDWLALRTLNPSLTNIEIAEKLGIAPHTLNYYINCATKEGWLAFSDPLERIEHEIIPQTIDNLSYLLKNKDKVTTIEVAKGTLFKTYEKAKGGGDAPITVLALKIEAASPDIQVRAISGQIVGTPRALDAEVIEEDGVKG